MLIFKEGKRSLTLSPTLQRSGGACDAWLGMRFGPLSGCCNYGLVARIPEASIGVRGALKSYLSDIKEIQRYLSYDLTPVGIEAIRPTAQKAVEDGDNVKEAVKPVLAAIYLVKTEMPQGN
jgi:hypothetical protein